MYIILMKFQGIYILANFLMGTADFRVTGTMRDVAKGTHLIPSSGWGRLYLPVLYIFLGGKVALFHGIHSISLYLSIYLDYFEV